VGDVASPIRRGGGVAFPKRQRDFSLGLNEKVWQMGVRTALSERWRRGEVSSARTILHLGHLLLRLAVSFTVIASQLAVIPTPPTLESISTRELSSTLSEFPDVLSTSTSTSTRPSAASKILFLVSSLDSNFALSARNLPNVKVELVDDIDVYPLLQGDRVVLDLEAVQVLDACLGRHRSSFTSSDSSTDIEMATPPGNWPTEDGSDSGAIYSNDPEVIEEEEAPVIWRRYPNDPLKRKEALDEIYQEKGAEHGDKVRDHLQEIEKGNGIQA